MKVFNDDLIFFVMVFGHCTHLDDLLLPYYVTVVGFSYRSSVIGDNLMVSSYILLHRLVFEKCLAEKSFSCLLAECLLPSSQEV